MLQKKTVKSVFDQMTKDLKAIRQKQSTKARELNMQAQELAKQKAAVDSEVEMAERAITNIESLFTKRG